MQKSKTLTWYSNELGYTHTLVLHVIAAASYLCEDPEEGRQMRIRAGIWSNGTDGKMPGDKPKETSAEKLIKGIE